MTTARRTVTRRPVTRTTFPKFDIYATGAKRTVLMDGKELPGVLDVLVKLSAAGGPAQVTVTFAAESVNAGTAAIMELLKKEE